MTTEVIERFVAYDWPGNVRELANVIERAIVLGSGPTVGLEDVPSRILTREPGTPFDGYSYRVGVNAARKEMVLKALARAGGNRAAAAKILGLEAKYLLKLMKALRIE